MILISPIRKNRLLDWCGAADLGELWDTLNFEYHFVAAFGKVYIKAEVNCVLGHCGHTCLLSLVR